MKNAILSLILKTLDSRKATAVAMWVLTRLLTPILAKWGIDPTPIIQGLDQSLNVIMAWLFAQGTIDAITAYKTPANLPPLPPPAEDGDGVPGELKIVK